VFKEMQKIMHLQVHLLPNEGVNKNEISSGFPVHQSRATDTVHSSKRLCRMQTLPWSKQMQARELRRTLRSRSSVPWAGAHSELAGKNTNYYPYL